MDKLIFVPYTIEGEDKIPLKKSFFLKKASVSKSLNYSG
jgi:hypothetical protein